MKRFSWNWIHYTITEFTKSIKSTVWQPAVGVGVGVQVNKTSDGQIISE